MELRNVTKLLVVDDIEVNRMILYDMFCEQYDVLEAENGRVALDLLHEHKDEIAIMLLDIVMPELDGFEVLKIMRDEDLLSHIPVILITGENDENKMLTGYEFGISDLVGKPFNPEIVKRRVQNVVQLYMHKREMEVKLREQREKLDEQSKRLRQFDQFIIDTLSTTVEFRDFESGEHIIRIRELVRLLLTAIRDAYPLDDEQIGIISNVSAMHDIGKIAIPDAILLKPGRLTKDEFEIMKTHTVRGCEILESIGSAQELDYYTYSYDICRHHHERWDGRGYPDGLVGDQISVWAHATALADVYDALTCKRVYKDAYSHEDAVQMILNGECGVFNPVLLDKFKEIQYNIQAALRGG